MTMSIDATHDPSLQSWVSSANAPDGAFPIQNLPFGRFRRAGSGEAWRIGVAIGDLILDLRHAAERGSWTPEVAQALQALAEGDLNRHMALPSASRRRVRATLSSALQLDSARQSSLSSCLLAQSAAQMAVPCAIGDYTDFYTGIHHATTAAARRSSSAASRSGAQ